MILLVNPPFYRFIGLEQDYVPLSLLAVGSKMVADGEAVLIKNMEVGDGVGYRGYSERTSGYDAYINALNDNDHPVWRELERAIELYNPDKIGVTVLNVKHKSALRVIEIAMRHGIKTMVGGNHPTQNPSSYPKGTEIFCGEYESDGGRLKGLDATPFPNFDILADKYSPNGYAHVLSARGCPFMCAFCASKIMWHRRVTFKSVERIISEMKYVHDRFGSDYFTFWDETFTLNKRRLADFCRDYSVPAKWRCDTRADHLTDDIIKMMVNSGCGQMSIGIESGDNDILRAIGKGESTDDFQRAADLLNKHGVEWKAYCIMGFPQDTEETIMKTISFIKSLKPFRITLSFFTPYQGTDLYEQVKEMGLIDDTYDISLFSHQSPYNYFCPKISRERYVELKKIVEEDVDNYNKTALKTWV